MWELDNKKGWVSNNWCFWTVMLEKTLESPLNCKEIQPVHPKGDQSWVFIGRTDVEAETPILWPPDVKSWLICKDPDAGKDWGQKEKGTAEDEMVVWHHWLNGHGFGWTLGVCNGQGGLACCGSWGHKEWDTKSDWTELNLNICWDCKHCLTMWNINNCCLLRGYILENSEHCCKWFKFSASFTLSEKKCKYVKSVIFLLISSVTNYSIYP